MEQQSVTEITIKGQKLEQFMAYIDTIPHGIGKQIEAFIQQVARENYLENNPPKKEEKIKNKTIVSKDKE